MNYSYQQQKIRLNLKPVERGLLFLFHRPAGDPVQVMQSWLNVHILLSRLRKSRTYCAKDVPLLVWQEEDQLHIKFHVPEELVVEECVFSDEETEGILTMLEKLPSWN